MPPIKIPAHGTLYAFDGVQTLKFVFIYQLLSDIPGHFTELLHMESHSSLRTIAVPYS